MALRLPLAGRDYPQTMIAFSDTMNQELCTDSWSLPWEDLARAEGLSGGAMRVACRAGKTTDPTAAATDLARANPPRF